ncbi:hypothetical protein VKT23_014382 [Stygiomarasmius scandens]|uniref:Uncharacterized protein n=1 Tax=Marasmiellus scandens TaxID=2682957 RepID=A0ABR1J0J5_9AGAR
MHASKTFMITAYHVAASNDARSVTVATVCSRLLLQYDALRMPLVEHRFQQWPVPQAYVHDCDVLLRGNRFRLFFQRHRYLPLNPTLEIQGDLIIMRVGQKNTRNVVNLRSGDTRLARLIARRYALFLHATIVPHLELDLLLI